jgi:hypothetical protein
VFGLPRLDIAWPRTVLAFNIATYVRIAAYSAI